MVNIPGQSIQEAEVINRSSNLYRCPSCKIVVHVPLTPNNTLKEKRLNINCDECGASFLIIQAGKY